VKYIEFILIIFYVCEELLSVPHYSDKQEESYKGISIVFTMFSSHKGGRKIQVSSTYLGKILTIALVGRLYRYLSLCESNKLKVNTVIIKPLISFEVT
jgi:hypothetical protein